MKKKKFYKKNHKKEADKKLPSNSRNIPEKFINDHSVFFLGIVLITIAIFFIAYDFYKNLNNQNITLAERQKVIDELNFWNREIIEKPNYRDGYFNLSLIYYQLGDYKNSINNLEKAMDIDPNFEKGKELKELLISN